MNADSYQKQDIKSSLLVEDDLYNNRWNWILIKAVSFCCLRSSCGTENCCRHYAYVISTFSSRTLLSVVFDHALQKACKGSRLFHKNLPSLNETNCLVAVFRRCSLYTGELEQISISLIFCLSWWVATYVLLEIWKSKLASGLTRPYYLYVLILNPILVVKVRIWRRPVYFFGNFKPSV